MSIWLRFPRNPFAILSRRHFSVHMDTESFRPVEASIREKVVYCSFRKAYLT